MDHLYRFFLILISMAPAGLVFWIKNLSSSEQFPRLVVVYILGMIAIVLTAYFAAWSSKFLGTDDLTTSDCTSIERADEKYLPTYLGYFFIALSTPSIEIFICVFIIIGLFIYFSRSSYYNPIFSLIGYTHYELAIKGQNWRVLLISKKTIGELTYVDKSGKGKKFEIKRIDDFSFWDYDNK